MSKRKSTEIDFIHGIYRTAPYMSDANWYLFIHKTEHARGHAITTAEAKDYRSTLEELSNASKKKRDAARKAGNYKEAQKWQKQIWIQQDPISKKWGGGTIKWKNLGLDSRIDPDSLRGKYHRMAGRTKENTILHIIHTEGARLVHKATRSRKTVEEMAARSIKTLNANGIIEFHQRSGFWHGVDWDPASLANVEREADELTEIQQDFRDKFGDLEKGFYDYLNPEESSWLKLIMDRAGCDLSEAAKINRALFACSKIPQKLPVRMLAEKGWRCGFNWVDPAIAESRRAEAERQENERLKEVKRLAKIAADKKDEEDSKEAGRIKIEQAETARYESLVERCRLLPETKRWDTGSIDHFIGGLNSDENRRVRSDATSRGYIKESDECRSYYGADWPEPIAPLVWKLNKLTKTFELGTPTGGTRFTFTQAHIDQADEMDEIAV